MKDFKVIFLGFLVVLLLNWCLSNLLDRHFKWWITVGLFVGFSVIYYFNIRKTKNGDNSRKK